MNSVTLRKADVLARVRENRQKHEQIYEEAVSGFRALAIEKLTESLEDAKAGKPVRQSLHLEEPQHRLDEYDTVVDMLEMSIDDQVELEEHEFKQYMRDDWSWKRQFLAANSTYSATARSL